VFRGTQMRHRYLVNRFGVKR